jgi:hypothetical protein
VDLYLSCLTIDRDGDIIDIDLNNWACWEAVRLAEGWPVPVEVTRLTRGNGASAWVFRGLWLLRGPGPARLFACDCAGRVLPLCEAAHPGDTRPRRAIEVARAYARGEATDEELEAARKGAADAAAVASDAAADAAAYAAYAAAYAAAQNAAAIATAAAQNAAAAAIDAAIDAYAAIAAARAERQWQTARAALYVSGALPAIDSAGVAIPASVLCGGVGGPVGDGSAGRGPGAAVGAAGSASAPERVG